MASSTEPPFDDSDASFRQPDGMADECALMFGRYRIQRELGRGGMGRVLLAYDTKLAIHVAVKVLPEAVIADAQAIDDLRGEVLRGIALNHGGIVRTHTFEMDTSGAAIVMEFVDGWTLADLKQERPGACFDVTEILPWLGQLCEILDYAHREARIVHRDLKPRNLMLTRAGRLKIADFGISTQLSDAITRTTGTGPSSGTPAYMSPQQTLGKTPSHLDDIYALAATIYDLLTGRPPFFRGHVVAQVLDATPPPMTQRREELGVKEKAAIPRAWENTVAACLAKEPENRPQSAGEVLARLCEDDAEIFESGEPSEAIPDAEPLSAPRRYTVAVMAAVVIVGGGLLWISFATSDHRQSETRNVVANVMPAPAPPAPAEPRARATPVPIPATPRIALAIAATPLPLSTPGASPSPATPVPATPAPATPAPVSMAKLTMPEPRATPVTAAPPQPRIIASKEGPWENSLGMRFVPVPISGGPSEGKHVLFSIWDTRVKDVEAYERGRALQGQAPPKGYVVAIPVSPQDFKQTPNDPSIYVSWNYSREFCAWLTKREHSSGKLPPNYSYRLPTDFEWSCAVGIGDREKGIVNSTGKARPFFEDAFPWGAVVSWPPSRFAGNFADEAWFIKDKGDRDTYIRGYNDNFAHTSPVGSFLANIFGLYDMAGNVRQWCEDKELPGLNARVMRGSSWRDYERASLLSSKRFSAEPGAGSEIYGFRCVVSDSAADKTK